MGNLPGSNFIHLDGTALAVYATTLQEKKLALKEVKLKKKEWAIQKRSITDQQKSIRAAYTERIRFRGSINQGGGRLGQIHRNFERVRRDGYRAQLAHDLAPLEAQKQQVEAMILAFDNLALKLEQQILSSGA